MHKTKHHYIKYTRAELESYTKHEESCVRKVKTVEPIRYSPTIVGNIRSSIQRILSQKIGKYDVMLDGIVLDFRNTKVLGPVTGILDDSVFSALNVETNFYVFAPRKGATVTGVVKYINRMKMETIISVVIYRVFNVKVTVKGKVRKELEKNQEIKIRVKDFHYETVIPFIEGEVIDDGLICKTSSKKLFDDTLDSGISESSLTSEAHKEKVEPIARITKIKQERESSVESSSFVRTKSRKRKISDELPAPVQKKVKSEPSSPTRNDPESTSLDKSKESKGSIAVKDISTLLEPSKKDKKRKKRPRLDDFETSLQMLIEGGKIKIEK